MFMMQMREVNYFTYVVWNAFFDLANRIENPPPSRSPVRDTLSPDCAGGDGASEEQQPRNCVRWRVGALAVTEQTVQVDSSPREESTVSDDEREYEFDNWASDLALAGTE